MTRPAPVVYAASVQRRKWLTSDATGVSVVSASASKANGSLHFQSSMQQDNNARAELLAKELKRGFSAPDSLRPRHTNGRIAAVDLAGSAYLDRYARLPGGYVAARAAVAIATLKGTKELRRCQEARIATQKCPPQQPRVKESRVTKKRLSFSPHRRLTKLKSKKGGTSPLAAAEELKKQLSTLSTTPPPADPKVNGDTPSKPVMTPAMKAAQEREEKWFKETYTALAEEALPDGPLSEVFKHMQDLTFTASTSNIPSHLVVPIEALPFVRERDHHPQSVLRRFPLLQDDEFLLSTPTSHSCSNTNTRTVINLVGTPKFRSVPRNKLIAHKRESIFEGLSPKPSVAVAASSPVTIEKGKDTPVADSEKEENVSVKSVDASLKLNVDKSEYKPDSANGSAAVADECTSTTGKVTKILTVTGGNAQDKPVDTNHEPSKKASPIEKTSGSPLATEDSVLTTENVVGNTPSADGKSSTSEVGRNKVSTDKQSSLTSGTKPSLSDGQLGTEKASKEPDVNNPSNSRKSPDPGKPNLSESVSSPKPTVPDFEMKPPTIVRVASDSTAQTPVRPTPVSSATAVQKSPQTQATPAQIVTDVTSVRVCAGPAFTVRPNAPLSHFQRLLKSLKVAQEEVEEAGSIVKKPDKSKIASNSKPPTPLMKVFAKKLAHRKKMQEQRIYDRRQLQSRQLNAASRKQSSTESGSFSLSAGTKRALSRSAIVSNRPKRKSRTKRPIRDWTSEDESAPPQQSESSSEENETPKRSLRRQGVASGTTQTSHDTPSTASKTPKNGIPKMSNGLVKNEDSVAKTRSSSPASKSPVVGAMRILAKENRKIAPGINAEDLAPGFVQLKFSETEPTQAVADDGAAEPLNETPIYSSRLVFLRFGSGTKKRKKDYSCFKLPDVSGTQGIGRSSKNVDPFEEEKDLSLPNTFKDVPGLHKDWRPSQTIGSKLLLSISGDGKDALSAIVRASNRQEDPKHEDEPQAFSSDAASEEVNDKNQNEPLPMDTGAPAEDGNGPSDEESEESRAKTLQSRVCGDMFSTMAEADKDMVKRWALRDFSLFQNGSDIMEVKLSSSSVPCDRCGLEGASGLCEESIVLKLWIDMTWRKIRRVRHVLGN